MELGTPLNLRVLEKYRLSPSIPSGLGTLGQTSGLALDDTLLLRRDWQISERLFRSLKLSLVDHLHVGMWRDLAAMYIGEPLDEHVHDTLDLASWHNQVEHILGFGYDREGGWCETIDYLFEPLLAYSAVEVFD